MHMLMHMLMHMVTRQPLVPVMPAKPRSAP
jgi:hypothetical protein